MSMMMMMMMADLVSRQSGCSLERFAARGARESPLAGVDGRVNFEVAAIHERSSADLADVARCIGRVAAPVSSQQCRRPIPTFTHLDTKTPVYL